MLRIFADKHAIRITLIYVVFGLAWIFLSDKALLLIVSNPDAVQLTYLQNIKGYFFILATAVLLLYLVRRNNNLLRNKHAMLNNVVDTANEGVWMLDENDNTTYVNDKMLAMLGYSRKEMAGKPIYKFVPQTLQNEARERIDRKRAGQTESGIFRFEKKDGSEIIGMVNSSPIIDDGIYKGAFAMISDMTSYYEQEATLAKRNKELNQRNEQYKTLIDAIGQIIYEWRPMKNYVRISGDIKGVMGYDPETVDQSLEWWKSLMHPDDIERFIAKLETTIRDKSDFKIQYRIKHAAGHYIQVYDSGKLVDTGDPEDIFLTGLVLDITDLVAIGRQKHMMNLLVENSNDFIAMANLEGEIIYLNKAGKALVNMDESDEISNLSIQDMLSEAEYQRTKEVIIPAIMAGGSWEGEGTLRDHRSGKDIPVNINSFLIKDPESGKPLALATVRRDISTMKMAEAKRLNHLLQGADEERERIAGELHDSLGQYLIASTINLEAVKSRLALEPKDKKRFEDAASFIQSAIDETRNIAQNLLPRALLDFGLEIAVQSFARKVSSSININLGFESNLGKERFDKDLELNLFRVIQETVTNAVKHAQASKISITLQKEKNGIKGSVADDGVGFDVASKSISGAGMGLDNIKNRVAMLDGLVQIESKKNAGTILKFEIPLTNK